MPRFRFNISEGEIMSGRDSVDLPNAEAARREAISLASRILEDQAQRVDLGEDWTMEVTDEHGLVLFRLDFHITAAPAVTETSGRG